MQTKLDSITYNKSVVEYRILNFRHEIKQDNGYHKTEVFFCNVFHDHGFNPFSLSIRYNKHRKQHKKVIAIAQ